MKMNGGKIFDSRLGPRGREIDSTLVKKEEK